MVKKRGRGLGLDFPGVPGENNALTDVPGVRVGYRTLHGDAAETQVRTGVTAILPRGHKPEPEAVWAGFHALNGNGEMTGVHWIRDAGHFHGPICLTNTHSVGIVHHAATRWIIASHGRRFHAQHAWALPVVAETYDGVLNDINGQHVNENHVFEAIDAAAEGPIAEGNVGGGTGMICYDFKGGTGTASRRLEIGGQTYTMGALVQANHGVRDWLTILGVPVGRHLRHDRLMERERGSIVVVLGTDVPALPHQLERIARRAALGIARHGTPGGNNSGDLFLAFSTANPFTPERFLEPGLALQFVPDDHFDAIYMAAVEATEEATVNAMLAAEDMPTFKPSGGICRAIDPGALLEVMARYGWVRK